MTRDAPARLHVAVVPALGVERVHAVKLDLPIVDLVADRGDHAAVFKLVEARLRTGKDNDGDATVSEGQQLHVPAQKL